MTPPQHGKSTLTSQLFPVLALATNPALKLILLSYAAELAGDHSFVARSLADEFGHILRPDGGLKLEPDAQAKANWLTTAGGYLKSASIQGTVTGRAADGIIIDDPFRGYEDSTSPSQREKVWATYSSVAETRLSPDGFVALIGTPWNPDDLHGRLLEFEREKWTVLRFPALAEADDVLGRAVGAPLFPERYSSDWYEDRRKTLAERGQSYMWDALYQCAPTGDGSPQEFAAYLPIPTYTDDLPQAACRLLVLSCDPSKSKSDKAGDYAAFPLVQFSRDTPPHLYVRSWALRTSAEAVSAHAVGLIEQYRPAVFAIETTMFQSLFADEILRQVKSKGLPTRILSYTAPQNLDKITKIRIFLGALLQQKRIHLHVGSPATRLFSQQIAGFPNPKEHDDLPDALVMAIWAACQCDPSLARFFFFK